MTLIGTITTHLQDKKKSSSFVVGAIHIDLSIYLQNIGYESRCENYVIGLSYQVTDLVTFLGCILLLKTQNKFLWNWNSIIVNDSKKKDPSHTIHHLDINYTNSHLCLYHLLQNFMGTWSRGGVRVQKYREESQFRVSWPACLTFPKKKNAIAIHPHVQPMSQPKRQGQVSWCQWNFNWVHSHLLSRSSAFKSTLVCQHLLSQTIIAHSNIKTMLVNKKKWIVNSTTYTES